MAAFDRAQPMKWVFRILLLALVVFIALFGRLIYYEVTTYHLGTSRDVSVRVLQEPRADGPFLVYEWRGYVWRGCDVTVRRKFIDRDGVEVSLAPLSLDPPPEDWLGETAYEVRVPLPVTLPAGRATYQAIEIPSCTWWQRLFPIEVPFPPVEFTVTPERED